MTILVKSSIRMGRYGAAKGTCSCRSVRGGAPPEPEHWNQGVLTPGPGRVLRDDQCALSGLRWQQPRTRVPVSGDHPWPGAGQLDG